MAYIINTNCAVCGKPTGSKLFTTCCECFDKIPGFPLYSKQLPSELFEDNRVYEDYLGYVLKKKNENVYLDDADYETKDLLTAYWCDTKHGIEGVKDCMDEPDEWEIKRVKVTYEILEDEHE